MSKTVGSTSNSLDPLVSLVLHELKLFAESHRQDFSDDFIKEILDQEARRLGINKIDEEEQGNLISQIKIQIENNALPEYVERYNPVPNQRLGYPVLSLHSKEQVWKALQFVHPLIMDSIDMKVAATMTRDQLLTHLGPIAGHFLDKCNIRLNATEQTLLEIMLTDEMVGFGPIEPLLADDSIADILVNSPDQVYVERFGKLQPCAVSFRDKNHLLHVINRIVSQVGRRIDESRPYVDARLQDGSRVNAIISPLAIDSPTLSIRKFNKDTITLEKMIERRSLSSAMAAFLILAVKCRLNILISGGTGSGKTTLLNAMSHAIPDKERIITIEDSAELQMQQDHIVRLESRAANIEGVGAVTERDLLRNALRMRPDRIILGEVRGVEAFDMLQAMNTGHDGSMSTIHANNTREVGHRLANMVSMAEMSLGHQAVFNQIGSVIELVVQVSRMQDGTRRVVEISEVVGPTEDNITLQPLFEFRYNSQEASSQIVGDFVYCGSDEPRCMKRAGQYGFAESLRAIITKH